MTSLLSQLRQQKARGLKSLAVLVDPDQCTPEQAVSIGKACKESFVSFIFVGGSLIAGDSFDEVVIQLKKHSHLPVIIFPGSNLHINKEADAILLLSLISGRNPELLIGQHIIAAPLLKRSKLEILSTGYMLVDSGKPTTVSYISNTTPIPSDKPTIAACTAMAGEMLGMSLIYLDAGSGALRPVPARMIASVKKAISAPLIVGGGINSAERAYEAFNAGADLIVVGNALEEDFTRLTGIAATVQEMNKAAIQRTTA